MKCSETSGEIAALIQSNVDLKVETEFVNRLLKSEHYEARLAAAMAAGNIGDRETIDLLTWILASDEFDGVRTLQLHGYALRALVQLRGLEAISTIEKHLASDDPMVRSIALKSVVELPSPTAIDILRNMNAQESDAMVRYAIAGALARLGCKDGVECLLAQLAHKGSLGYFNAASYLAKLCVHQGLLELRAILRDMSRFDPIERNRIVVSLINAFGETEDHCGNEDTLIGRARLFVDAELSIRD